MQLHLVLSSLILVCCLLRDIHSSSGKKEVDHDHDDHDYGYYDKWHLLHELKGFWKHYLTTAKHEGGGKTLIKNLLI